MKILFVFLPFLILFGCGKQTDQPIVVNIPDSLWILSGPVEYNCDLNGDSINDITISGFHHNWPTYQIEYFKVISLNSQTEIHAIAGTQPMCSDTTTQGGYSGQIISDCTGGANMVYIDSFIYTPNIPENHLGQTIISPASTDTVLVYYSHLNSGVPYPNFTFLYEHYGFFSSASSGFALFSVAGNRYALKFNLSVPYLIISDRKKLD